MAKTILADLRNGQVEYVNSLLSDELKSETSRETLEKAASFFHPGELLSAELIGSQVNVTNQQWTGNFTYEYHFESGWNLANAALRKTGDSYWIIGINVYQTKDSQKALNQFTLKGKSLAHYFILSLVIATPLFIFVTMICFFRTSIPRRRWRWLFFILVGIGSVQINWTTGEYAFQLLAVQLLGAGVIAAGPHAPWLLSAGLPIGAIMFWIKRSDISTLTKTTEAEP